jgi:Outer membrane protein beta-barrel domain
MKKILVAVVLSSMLIPAFASAELNYNSVDAGYSTTNYSPSLTELNIGISKSISGNVYLGASYRAGSQPTYTSLGDRKVSSISVGAGYRTPLKDNVDAFVKGNILLGSVKLAGNSVSANGYDIGAGVRAQLIRKIEGTLAVVHTNTSSGALANTKTFFNAQLGFDFTQTIQLTAGLDFKSDPTTSLGVRFFY